MYEKRERHAWVCLGSFVSEPRPFRPQSDNLLRITPRRSLISRPSGTIRSRARQKWAGWEGSPPCEPRHGDAGRRGNGGRRTASPASPCPTPASRAVRHGAQGVVAWRASADGDGWNRPSHLGHNVQRKGDGWGHSHQRPIAQLSPATAPPPTPLPPTHSPPHLQTTAPPPWGLSRPFETRHSGCGHARGDPPPRPPRQPPRRDGACP